VGRGADPLVRTGPPGPAATAYTEHADEGVGCGPGGPPHWCGIVLMRRRRLLAKFAVRLGPAALRPTLDLS
jgi:hypothetical protein